jgi:DNA-directed RNA polymerase subunit alpha
MGRPVITTGHLEPGPRSGILPPDRYNTPIEELALSVRAYNCLKRSGLMTVGQVLEKSEEELLALRNFGRKSYDELRDRLIELNFIEDTPEGLHPKIDTGRTTAAGQRGPASRRPAAAGARPASAVILDEEDEEESLGALGKALKEALKEVGDDDLLGADDED